MNLTRENHLQYLVKLIPFLVLACAIQSYLYPRFVPTVSVQDVALFLFVGMACIVGAFAFYDRFHQVKVYRNFLSVSFSPLDYQEDILYQDIQAVTVTTSRHNYFNLVLTLKEGREIKIYYVDSTGLLLERIRERNPAFASSFAEISV